MNLRHSRPTDLDGAARPTRREFVTGAAALSLVSALYPARLLAQSSTFDFYIGPNGSDSNPGTQSSPWAITALITKNAIYAGKRVGLLDGTYNLYSIWTSRGSVQAEYDPLFPIAAGSAASPTVIQAVNPQQAILNAKSGSSRIHQPALGHYGTQNGSQYIQIRNLVVYGCGGNGCISFYGTNAAPSGSGLLIEGCDISDMYRSYGSTQDNTAGIWITGISNAIVRNCRIHDINNPAGTHNACGVMLYGAQDTLIENCTMFNIPAGVFDKQQVFYALPNQGTICRYNHFYSINNPIYGFDNGGGKSYPYSAYYIYNNVIENCAEPFMAEYGDLSLVSPTYFYNNTIIANADNAIGYATVWLMAQSSRLVNFYNNIINSTNSNPGYQGRIVQAPGGWAVSDFNLYGPLFSNGLTPGLANNGLTTQYTSLSTWRAVTGNPDAHSLIGDPKFVGGSGNNPNRFKLQPDSLAVGSGRIKGLLANAVSDMGAWAGVSQIGYNSGGAIAPVAPVIEVR